MSKNFLERCEMHVVKHEPDKSAEELFAELQRLEEVHKEFNAYLRANNIVIKMPKKSSVILERRRLFIDWYAEKHQDRPLKDVVEELTILVFASETTITNTIFKYR